MIMDIHEFLTNKGFELNIHGIYTRDVYTNNKRELLLIRCTPRHNEYKAEIIVQLGEPSSHIMTRLDIGLDQLERLDIYVSELTLKALNEYHKLLINEYKRLNNEKTINSLYVSCPGGDEFLQ